jgi:ABC-type phosphate transport system substrate-binding protein
MRPSYCIAATATILALLTVGSAGAQTVRIGGTGAATALMQSLGSAFSENSEDPVDVIPSLGTNGAIRAVAAGALDIAVSGRALTPQEEAAGLVVLSTMRTPFGFLSSRSNPPGLATSDIAALFDAGRRTHDLAGRLSAAHRDASAQRERYRADRRVVSGSGRSDGARPRATRDPDRGERSGQCRSG